MTTTQTPVDALAAQARECADSLRLVSQTRRVQDACDVLEQCARALSAIPEPTAPAQDAQGVIKPWEERVKPDFPNTDPRSWKPGISLGGVESHMKEEIDELRAALRASSPADTREPLTDEQIEDMRGEANRGFNIERDEYFKAFRDAEFIHGIVTKEST